MSETNECRFKPGDRVRCVNAACWPFELVRNAVYTVCGVHQGDYGKKWWVDIEGAGAGWDPSRFELVEDVAPADVVRSKPPFKVGDRVRCVDAVAAPELTAKNIYTVVDCHEGDDGDWWVYTSEAGGGWAPGRFVLENVEPTQVEPRPSHDAISRRGGYAIPPATFIAANNLPFNIGNAVKYALRYGEKDGVQDLREAIRHLEIEIECIKRRERVEAGEPAAIVWGEPL